MFVEHVNVTVTDPEKSAEILTRIFDWYIRWEGPSLMGGRTVHVGTDDSYLALYTPGDPGPAPSDSSESDSRESSSDNNRVGGLQHIGVLVDDLGEIKRRVKAEGYNAHTHMKYEPGERFYFEDRDGIEFEVVTYTS